MRSAANPGLQIDWAEFDSVNRHEAQDKLLAKEMKVGLSAINTSYMYVPVWTLKDSFIICALVPTDVRVCSFLFIFAKQFTF